MTLMTLARGLAMNVGLVPPSQVYGSPLREWQEVLQMANETGEELARRVEWGQLTNTAQLPGADPMALPDDFSRLVTGIAVRAASGEIVRPLTRGEWNNLPPATGNPRYFLLESDAIRVWPQGDVTIWYQSDAWCFNGLDRFTADDQSSRIDEDLFLKGLIVRWRRQKAMPYADEEAEFEAALAQFAQANDRARF